MRVRACVCMCVCEGGGCRVDQGIALVGLGLGQQKGGRAALHQPMRRPLLQERVLLGVFQVLLDKLEHVLSYSTDPKIRDVQLPACAEVDGGDGGNDGPEDLQRERLPGDQLLSFVAA